MERFITFRWVVVCLKVLGLLEVSFTYRATRLDCLIQRETGHRLERDSERRDMDHFRRRYRLLTYFFILPLLLSHGLPHRIGQVLDQLTSTDTAMRRSVKVGDETRRLSLYETVRIPSSPVLSTIFPELKSDERFNAALALAMSRDGSSGGTIRMAIIQEDGVERIFVPGDKLPSELNPFQSVHFAG